LEGRLTLSKSSSIHNDTMWTLY